MSTGTQKELQNLNKKSRIRETPNLSTGADSSTEIFFRSLSITNKRIHANK